MNQRCAPVLSCGFAFGDAFHHLPNIFMEERHSAAFSNKNPSAPSCSVSPIAEFNR